MNTDQRQRRQHRVEEAGVRAVAAMLTWHGGKDRSALRLYVDLLRREAEAGSYTFTASADHLADTAGFGFSDLNGAHLDTSAMRAARRRLEALGLVEVSLGEVNPDAKWHARTTYRVLPSPRLAEEASLVRTRVQEVSPYSLTCNDVDELGGESMTPFDVLQHIVWEEKGLGINALRVWLCLAVLGPLGPKRIRDALSLSKGTVHNQLQALVAVGLADSDRGTWSVGRRSLGAIAAELGLEHRKATRTAVRKHRQRGRRRAFGDGPIIEADPFARTQAESVSVVPHDRPLTARVTASEQVQVPQDPRKRLRATERPISRDRHLRLVA